MSSLRQLKLQQELRQGAKRPRERDWTQTELNDGWRKVTTPILNLADAMANMPDSLDAVAANQKVLSSELTDFATMSPQDLQAFCQQLRALWTLLDHSARQGNNLVHGKAREILDGWWREHSLDDEKRWNVYFQTGTIFPTHQNYHALIARVCFDNRLYLGVCANPDCKKFFIKPLRNSKYCKDCYAYDNRKRQQKRREKIKSARKITGGKN